MKILVAEYEPNIMRYIQFHLEKAGYEVVTTDSAREALILVEREQPELAIISSLSDMPGDELARTLRQRQPHPLLLLTAGRASDPVIINRWRDSSDRQIIRPFHPLALLAAVKELLPPTA